MTIAKKFRFLTGAILAALVALTAVGASAQSTVFDNPGNRARFGARVSLDVTCPGSISSDNGVKLDMFGGKAGISFGAVYQLPLVANLYVEPGAMFYYDVTSVDTSVYSDLMDPEFAGMKSDMSLREFGLRVPVVVGYHFDFEQFVFKVFTGPQFDMGFRGRQHVTMKDGNVTVSESEGMYDMYNRLNVLWRLGAGIEIDNIDIELAGAFGMRNMVDVPGKVEWKRSLFQLTLGYNF